MSEKIIYYDKAFFRKFMEELSKIDIDELEKTINKVKHEMEQFNNVSKAGIDENICK